MLRRPPDAAAAAPPGPARWRAALIAAALVAAVVAVYAPVGGFAFVDFDDGEYVYENAPVLAGLTADGVAWAFTTRHAANWHPVTWLSHMLDVELWGMWPGGHHGTNVALHAANAVLVFLLLAAGTGATWSSAAVAALFALHPLRVESVAWVAERKDLLCALFALAAIGAWGAWTKRGGAQRYAAALVFLALALMSKPMAVTLPCALLLLDLWPLGRLASRADAWPRLREKLPFFALAAASSWVTWRAQAGLGAAAEAASFPWTDRFANAALSWVRYLADFAWPSALAFYYPHPNSLGRAVPRGPALAAAALLLAVTVVALRGLRRRPWLAVGWLWYLGTLVPAIGLVQVGSQARADRYTYLPALGVAVIAAFAARELARRAPRWRPALAGGVAAAILALAVAARAQVATWRDGETLYRHATEVTADNWMAWNNLGVQWLAGGRLVEARDALLRALALKRDHATAWYNLGVCESRLGDPGLAARAYRQALRLEPDYADAWVNLGLCTESLGGADEARDAYRRALALRPSDPFALAGLARLGAR